MPGRNCKLPVGDCNSVWEHFSIRLEKWDVPSRSSKLSSQKTKLNTGSNNHLPPGRLNTIHLGEIFNIRSTMQFFVRKFQNLAGGFIAFQLLVAGYFAHLTVPTSGWRIDIYLAEAWNFLVRGWSSRLLETIIFQQEHSILPGWAKFSTSGWRIQFFLGNFNFPGG